MSGTRLLALVLGFWVLMRAVNKDSGGRTLIDRLVGNPSSVDPLLSMSLSSSSAGPLGAGSGSYGSLAGSGLTFAGPDQGVDFTGRGAVYAPADSKVISTKSNSGWPGEGNLTVLQFLNGPAAGRYWYIAEDFRPSVSAGATVAKGQPVGLATGSGRAPGIETGFAQGPSGAAYGTPNMGKPGGPAPTFGIAFGNLLKQLTGAHA